MIWPYITSFNHTSTMTFIYVLALQSKKYYVGKTDNPKFRIQSHFKSGGCAWTKKYKPMQIIGLFPGCDDFDEDKYTLKYMKKYGIQNVRGGSFCTISLNNQTKKCLEQMICGANDKCHLCGKKGHFVRDCTKKQRGGTFVDKELIELSRELDHLDNGNIYERGNKLYLWWEGQLYEESNRNTPKQLLNELQLNGEYDCLKYKWKKWRENTYSNKCRRCGRKGHSASKCYASRHIQGYII